MLTITVYQASGAVCTYVQDDTEAAAQLLDRINPAKLFTEARILIGSPLGLAIFSGHCISRIDLEADKTLESLLPAPQPGVAAQVVSAEAWDQEFLNPDAPADYGIPEGGLYTSGIRFGLLGNHVVSAKIAGDLEAPMDRINSISHILTHPHIRLALLPHGATLINPAALTSVTLQPAFSTLPQDVWPATRIG